MNTLAKISRAFAALIPGTAAHLAKQKRRFKIALRNQGFTRSEAIRLTAERFRKDG